MFKNVYHKDTILNFEDFRQQYKYISIVYLLNGCESCYEEFIDWQNNIEVIGTPKNYTVLFIVRGDNYESLISKIQEIEQVENKYYVIMDPDYKYIVKNMNVPKWIMDASLLIDNENRIIMVGKPWSNESMKGIFRKLLQE
ncbi:hypothetical protein [Marinifilum caeruleilacunae]|uniref:Redoxin domain-containing protein n=1 Tax=Marinifilum caeruleilacunae TaxID=2499076 RepID=A0ABX1X1S1_9BACT|nr:hypothetical protein [Marinifilum caeruleilacunae]NOU62029.1 hypothetical protein [Marinifilum caeruleilacunae]